MAKVQIYRTSYCPYCDMAKKLFLDLGVEFEEIDVTNDPDARMNLVKMSGGRRTVPQIFINGEPVGGYTDVRELQNRGKLKEMLER